MAKIQGGVDLVDTVQIAPDVTPDGQVVNVKFRNVIVGVGGDIKTPSLSQTKAVTIRVPVGENPEAIDITLDVRGRVEVSGRAKAVLLLHAAGETIQLEPIRAAKESEYHHRIQGRLAGGNDYLAIFVLIVAREQATSENNALLDVSTADLSLGVHAAV